MKWAFRLFVVIVSTFLCLGTFELILRANPKLITRTPRSINLTTNTIFDCYQLDPFVIYRTIPNNPSCDPIDSSGFRLDPSSPFDYEKTIVVLGDSFVFGAFVGGDETYPYYFEQMLRNAEQNVRVINAGIPGYGTDQEYLYFQKYVLPVVKPDLVLWNIHENDWEDNESACLISVHNGRLVYHSARHNTMYLLVRLNMLTPSGIRALSLYKFLYSIIPERYTIGCSPLRGTSTASISEKMAVIFQDMAFLAQKNNFQVRYVFVQNQIGYAEDRDKPADYDQQIEKKISLLKKMSLNPLVIQSEIVKYLSAKDKAQVLGITTDNLTDDLFVDDEEPDPWGYRHMNATGNFLYAKAVYEKLSQ